jgi:hypothetical protein
MSIDFSFHLFSFYGSTDRYQVAAGKNIMLFNDLKLLNRSHFLNKIIGEQNQQLL